MGNELKSPKNLKMLFTICNRSKADFFMSVLEGFEVNLQTVVYAKGTAPNDILKVLGAVEPGKAIVISLVKEERIKEILAAYEDRYFKVKGAKGIAFTVGLDSIIGVSAYLYLANIKEGGK